MTTAPAFPASIALRVPALLRAVLPGAVLAALVALAVALVAPAWWWPSAQMAALYVLTPLAKEAWLAIAPVRWGLPVGYVFVLILSIEAVFCLVTLRVAPERLALRMPRLGRRLRRLHERVAASRFARRSLALALGAILMTPIHSGGAVLGTVTGRSLGLSRRATACTVLGAGCLRLLIVLLAIQGFLLLHG